MDYSFPGLPVDMWQADGILFPYLKDFILRLLNSCYENYQLKNPELWVKDVTIIGSTTTTKYIKTSDVDVHVIVDLDQFINTNMPNASKEEALEKLDQTRKEFDRAKIILPLTERPAEFFFESDLNPSNTELVGRYSLLQDKWVKAPIYFAQDDDFEESRKNAVEGAKELANELDASFGEIGRQIQRIDELKEVLQAWPEEKRQLYYDKIEKKLDIIEEEIEKSVQIKQDLVDERHEKQDALSDNEIKFKFLSRFHYFATLQYLKSVLEQTGGEVSTTELPLIEKIISEGALQSDFDSWFAGSKVVDSNGKPLLCHHETNVNFKKVNPKKTTMGIFWFTTDRGSIDRGETGAAGHGMVKDFYVSMKNPAGWEEYEKLLLVQLKSQGYDGALLPKGDGTYDGFVFDNSQIWWVTPKKTSSLNKQADVVEISTTYSRGEFPVLIDPTEDEELELIKKSEYDELRYLEGANGNRYVWDAYRSTHAEVARELHYRGFDVDENSVRGTLSEDRGLTWPEEEEVEAVSSLKQAFLKEAFEEPKEAETDICIDLDKTIAQDATFPAIGEPIEGAKESLAKLQEMGYNIVIYSCRADSEDGLEFVREWLDKHEIPYDSIFEGEKPFSKYFIDDKAIHFDSWKNVLKQVEKSDKTASLHIVAMDAYYHGGSGASVRQMAKDGYVMAPLETGKAHQSPLAGRAYLTKDLGYALIYALGADMVGYQGADANYGSGDAEGGIVLVAPNEDALIPDEDWLGEQLTSGYMGDSNPTYEKLQHQQALAPVFNNLKKHNPRDSRLYEMAYQSMLGKMAIRILMKYDPTYLKELAKESHSMSHEGNLKVLQAWVFDKVRDNPKLKKDGSNFFQIAQEIPVTKTASLKQAALATKYWLDPQGRAFVLDRKESHPSWIMENLAELSRNYGIDVSSKYTQKIANEMFQQGWVRVTSGQETSDSSDFAIEVADITNIPPYIDNFIAQKYSGSNGIEVSDLKNDYVKVDDPFPYIQDQVNKSLRQPMQASRSFSKKEIESAYNPYSDPKLKEGPAYAVYIGAQEVPGREPVKLYNIFGESPRFGSTVSEQTLKELNIPIKQEKQASVVEAYLLGPNGEIIPVEDYMDHTDAAFKKLGKSLEDLLKEGWATLRAMGSNLAFFKVESLQNVPPAIDNYLASHKFNKIEVGSYYGALLSKPPEVSYEDAIEQGIQKAINKKMVEMQMSNMPKTAEQKSDNIEYACVMADIPKEISQEIVEWGVRQINDSDLYTENNLGRELDSHITIKYGIISDDVKQVEKLFKGIKQFKATLGDVKHFSPEGREFDVLTVSVESKDLSDMNGKITKELKCATGLPSDEYHPHITIAYIKKGKCKDLYGNKEFVGKEITIDSVEFSPVEGDKTTIELGNKKEAAYRGNMDCWLAPDGKEYSVTRSHTAWVVDEANLLKQQYGLILPAEGSPEDDNLIAWLLSKGWVRVSGVLPTELDLLIQDINNIPQVAEQFVWKYKPEMVIVEDLQGNDTSFDREEYSKGMMKKASGNNFLPSLVQAPNNEWQFQHGGDDQEIPVDPDSQSDQETLYEPCTTGKPRSADCWRQFLSIFKQPLSKKENMTIEAGEAEEWDSHYGDIWHVGDKVKDKITGKIGIIKSINGTEVELEEVGHD